MKYPYTVKITEQLNNIAKQPGHGYIFHGPDGSGKYLAALELSRLFIGDKQIVKDHQAIHPNMIIINPLETKRSIGIDQIRSVNEKIWHTSSEPKIKKVIIIESVDKLTVEASNALLKNLEDTPPNTVFLLLTNNISKVLATIRSRAQIVYFEPISQARGVEYLQKHLEASQSQAIEMFDLARGSLGGALELGNDDLLGHKKTIRGLAETFMAGNITERFVITKMVFDEDWSLEFLEEISYAIRRNSTILSVVNNLENIVRASQQIQSNVNARTVIENLGLQLSTKEENS